MPSMAAMRLVVCASAGPGIGVGHVMRCLALAGAWRGRGGAVAFAGAFPEALEERIRAAGCDVLRLAEGASPDQVLDAALGLPGATPQWVVLDGYDFRTRHHRRVRESGARLLVVDDCMDAGRFEADAILNQNPQATSLAYDAKPGCRVLAGLEYALLRPEFAAARPGAPRQAGAARRILVTMGGADPDNAAGAALEALERVPDELDIIVVAGQACAHGPALEAAVRASAHGAVLRRSVRDMAALMADVDFALTAGGSTCWELCCLGVPFATVILADNQEAGARALERGGVAPCLGWAEGLDPEAASERLRALLADGPGLAELSRRGMELVDGLGAGRVAGLMLAEPASLRPAEPGDSRMVWEWANDPTVRAVSFDSASIPFEDHERWYAARMADPGCAFYIVLDAQGLPVGQVRFAVDGADADISVSLAPQARGRGLGAEAILAGARAVAAARGVERVHAYIKQDNAASVSAFAQAGFRPAAGDGGHAGALHFISGRPAGGAQEQP